MKIRWKSFIISLVIPLAVGFLASLLSKQGMADFEQIAQPPLSPPMSLFPIVWTILYLLMGYASYRVYVADVPREASRKALILYALQLAFNFIWTLVFFSFGQYLYAFICLIVLWILILSSTIRFFGVDKPSGWLMMPYLIWVTFAGYLNYGVYMLN